MSTVVVLMGCLALGLALATGEYYQREIFEHQREALGRIATLKAKDLLEHEAARARDLGLSLQSSREFREAYAARDRPRLTELLFNQFHQYFVTAGILNLKRIRVLDADYSERASATTATGEIIHGHACPKLIRRAVNRKPAERIKPLFDICSNAGHPYSTTLVAVGGLNAIGYVEITTDPVQPLSAMQTALDFPIRIHAHERLVYSSPRWNSLEGQALMARAVLNDAEGEEAIVIELGTGTEKLAGDLRKARYLVLLLASVLTFSVIVLVSIYFNLATLAPLKKLTQHVRVVRSDRTRLGERLSITANAEIAELADDFNELTAELKNLHIRLESMAFLDPLTNLPNRVLFRDRLEQQLELYRAHQAEHGFALLAIDLNGFKKINDSLGHHAGDELLREAGYRMKSILRKSDTVALTGPMVARLGGDEFFIILPMVTERSQAASVAAKIQSVVEEPIVLEGQTVKVGMSIGIALCPLDGVAAEELCKAADQAMYRAKRSRDHFQFASDNSFAESR